MTTYTDAEILKLWDMLPERHNPFSPNDLVRCLIHIGDYSLAFQNPRCLVEVVRDRLYFCVQTTTDYPQQTHKLSKNLDFILFKVPIEDIPLYINDPVFSLLAKWRLVVGK